MSALRPHRAFVLAPSLLLLALGGLTACGGAEAAEPAQPTKAQASSTAVEQGCQRFFTRARECTGPYIDALVGLRIELDRPAGIAARAAAEGKPALVELALAEWAEDSKSGAIEATCQQVVATIPPEQLDGLAAGAEQCLALTDCEAFSTCAIALQRPQMAAGAR
jgi:hypothetical protein